MTVNDILSLTGRDISRMSDKELRKAVQTLASAGNKRIERLRKSGVRSPALDYIDDHGGKFSTRGKTSKAALKNELVRASDFMQAKTSTIKGAKALEKEQRERFGDVSRETLSSAGSIYRKIREAYPQLIRQYGSEQVMKMSIDIRRGKPDMSVDEAINEIIGGLIREYEKEQENFMGSFDFSEEFEY